MFCSTFVDHLYIENEENDDFAVEKRHETKMKNKRFSQHFLGPFIYLDHVGTERQFAVQGVKNAWFLLDFSMFFAWFFEPIGMSRPCFCSLFLLRFFECKIASRQNLAITYDCRFLGKNFGVKKRVCLCSWWSLTSQRYGVTYAFLMILYDEACLILKKVKNQGTGVLWSAYS